MANAARWYATREAVKAAVGITGAKVDTLVDSYIESASEAVENLLGRRFIPRTATRYYPWPQYAGHSLILYLDEDLLAVTTLQSEAQDAAPTEILVADYFLEPINRPPYHRIEIDLSSSSAFQAGDTSQRSISVLGRWGYSEDTKAAGTVALVAIATSSVANPSVITTATDHGLTTGDTVVIAGHAGSTPDINGSHIATVLTGTTFTIPVNVTVGGTGGTVTSGFAANASVTTLVCSDGSLIEVGDTLLIETEALFVSDRAHLTIGTTMVDTLTASPSDVTVTLADGTKAKQGEVLLFDSEKMLVETITGNDLTVERAYDGTVLAAHSSGITVYAPRTLTVVRAVNGTTAAAHDDALAITKYAPPADVMNYVRALAINSHKQGSSGWTGQIGGGEGTVETRMAVFGLTKMRDELIAAYGQVTM